MRWTRSFFATYKKELIHTRPWNNLTEVWQQTFLWIEGYYNKIRNTPPAESMRASDIAKRIGVVTQEPPSEIPLTVTEMVLLGRVGATLAARYCDRLVLLDRGEVLAAGQPHDVLPPSVLEPVYGVAVRTLAEPDCVR
ncbi:MAG: hypothetical protein ACRDRW_10300 [Pseudonocardiaceae bacterium]